jgi:hypothetical protein
MTERMIEWLIERSDRKNPGYEYIDERSERGWEAWVLRHMPAWFTIEWYRYLFGDPGDRWHRAGTTAWINLWGPPWLDWYEFTGWLKGGRWHHVYLFEETRTYRIYCRLRGHPNGMVFYNPWGYEPDTSCQDCGEEIG